MKKIKVLTLGDHPLSPSGVGTQSRYIIESLLKTGRYSVTSFGGAVKHVQYEPQKIEGFGEDWIVYPVDGYGTPDLLRSAIRHMKPDILWFMTDPRFWGWLWQIDNEVRSLAPMIYYHVWDNIPYPKYNKPFYESNDLIVSISKVTDDIVKNVAPSVQSMYLPHSVDTSIFKPLPEKDVKDFREEHMAGDPSTQNKMVFFWNNRNARRKQSGTLIFWFKEFLDKVGHDKACLLMHTDVNDPNGQDLQAIIQDLELDKGQVLFSTEKVDPRILSLMYNMVDCTINISDAEGFGLSTLESLACGIPIIVNMTGGLQEQVTDGNKYFGVGIEPSSKAIIGSQQVPYIFEDRISKEDFVDALMKIYNMPKGERKEVGLMGRQHVLNNYNFENYCKKWIEIFDDMYEKHGSWETRKNYKAWRLIEVA